jgi:hypothetical protein
MDKTLRETQQMKKLSEKRLCTESKAFLKSTFMRHRREVFFLP